MKLDYPALEGTGIEGVTYTLGLGKIGSFAFNVPAGSATAVAIRQAVDGTFSPSEKAPIIVWIYDSAEGLVFKGKIDAASYTTTPDGKKMLAVSGPSVAIELQQRTVGLGLQWEDVAFSTAVSDILNDTDWSAGELDSAVNVPARRMDARQKWDALLALADIYQMLVREDNLNSKVDIGAFGESSGLFLTNQRSDIITLDDDPTTVPITNLKVLARANDIVNRVYPVGQIQGLGGAVLTLSGVSSDNPVATRIYLPSTGSPAISPSFDSSWEKSNTALRRPADIARSSTAMTTDAFLSGVASANYDTACYQYVYGPIGAQTLAGNVTAQLRMFVDTPAVSDKVQMCIRVIAADGATVRGTLLSHGTYGTDLIFTTATNHTFPSTAMSSVEALDGDYIVVEVGYRQVTATSVGCSFRVGDAASADLPVDETTTDDLNPWIEFSTYIVPQLTADTTYAVQSVTLNGTTHYYLEDADSVAKYGLRDRVLNVKDILPLGLSLTALAQASATLYSVAVTYLQRHKDPQVAYEVECVGLRHMRNGTPYFEMGDTLTLDYVGTYTDDDGTLREDLRVRQDLYIMAATRSYGPAGESTWKLTVSTIARALPNDGDLIAAMLTEIGVAKISPLGFFQFGTADGTTIMQLNEFGMMLQGATTVTDLSTAIYWLANLAFQGDVDAQLPRAVLQASAGTYSGKRQSLPAFRGYGATDRYVGINSTVANTGGADIDELAMILESVYGSSAASVTATTRVSNGVSRIDVDADITRVSGWFALGDLAASTQTIATGAITPDASMQFVDTEGGAATDDLDTITVGASHPLSGRPGSILVLRAANSARTVVVKDGTGNIQLAGDCTLDNTQDTLTLMWTGAVQGWLELARSNNGV